MHWKYCLIIIILVELIYRLIIFVDSRCFFEPFYITLIKCPKEFLRLEYHLGLKSRNLLTKFYYWYRCRIVEMDFYVLHIIRAMEISFFLILLANIIC